MTFKERLYKLDELGPIGTQKKIPTAERKKIEKETAEFIRAHRESLKKGKAKKPRNIKLH